MKQTETLAKLACAYSGVVWGLFWIPLRALDGSGITGAWATVLFYLVPAVLFLPIALWRWRALLAGGWGLQLTGLVTGTAVVLYADGPARYDPTGGPTGDPTGDSGRPTPFTQ